MASLGDKLVRIARGLSRELSELRFAPPVTHVYNPLDYASGLHARYLRQHARREPRALLLGMNPGPWGMAQTGVPFGDVTFVRDWLGIAGKVGRPEPEHPKRPIQGLSCARSEVSGTRLWGWAAERFGTPDRFFATFFIHNYCPLCFMEDSGRNRTPDKLPAEEREPLFDACDRALQRVVDAVAPERIIGIGTFAEGRARRALAGHDLQVDRVLHPSPASPIANRGWAAAATAELRALGVDVPGGD